MGQNSSSALETEDGGARRETQVYRFPVQQLPGTVLEARSKGVVSPAHPSVRPEEFALQIENIVTTAGSAEQVGTRVYERARQVLDEAYESAAEVRIEAFSKLRQQLAEIGEFEAALVGRANDEAAAIRSQAEQEAQLALQRAQREADQIVAEATEQAARLVAQAAEQAETARTRAEIEIRDIHSAGADALNEIELRLKAMQELEATFDRNAREFARWLGLTVEPGKTFFSTLGRKK